MSTKHRKHHILTEKDFNKLNSEGDQTPRCDFPGSENDIAMEEILMGMEYEEDEINDDPDPLP